MGSGNVTPDVLYLQSRESLLPYEDARMNSLIQAVANFYMTRNDQSTWGNCLRSIAEELAKLEYDYAYDLINKIPSYLTPPDIRRRWADPCYVTANWPSPTQFDTDFKTMLVDLIAAYRLGSTVVSIQDVIFAYTGINITVQQLYQFIGDGFYDQSDRNAIKVSVNVGGTNPLTSITSLNQLQAITQSLYGAIDLAKPAHVGLEFTTVFGEGENLDCLLSPTFLTQQMFDSLVNNPVMQGYYSLNAYVSINPSLFWQASVTYINPNRFNGLGLTVVDSNGNLQMVTAIAGSGLSGITTPVWSLVSGGVTIDNQVTWTNISPAVTNTHIVSNVLTVLVNNTVQVGQQVKFVNLGNVLFLNGKKVTVLTSSPTQFTATFIDSTLVTQVAETSGNLLTITCQNDFQAGNTVQFSGLLGAGYLNGQTVTVLTASGTQFTANDPTLHGSYPAFVDAGTAALIGNPSTAETQGTAAYLPATPISITQFNALSTQFKTLYQAQYVNSNCSGTGIKDTLRIFIRGIEEPPFQQMLIQAPVLNPANPMTTVSAWGQKLSPTLSPAAWAALPRINFTITNSVSNGVDATYTYTALNNTPGGLTPPVLALHEGELVTVAGCTRSTLNGTARIKNVTATSFQIPNTRTLVSQAEGSATGVVGPTLQSAYQLQFGQYVLLQAPPLVPVANPSNMPPTPKFTVPTLWVALVTQNGNTTQTGEVAGWDFLHPAGLLAPRLDQVWEIGGGDQFFIFGLT